MTLVETAAFSVLYAVVIEVFIHRDIPLRRLPEIFVKGIVVMGGVLVILSAANGLQYYIIDAQIPGQLASWLHGAISSKYVFLALLNVALLVVGCFMDIYSAITVVVPLIIPIAIAYGIHPVHLGIIFLANMELGYLTPPVGLEPLSRLLPLQSTPHPDRTLYRALPPRAPCHRSRHHLRAGIDDFCPQHHPFQVRELGIESARD